MDPGNNEGLLSMNLQSVPTRGTIRPSCSPSPTVCLGRGDLVGSLCGEFGPGHGRNARSEL
jgi:hypothetical protein